MATNDTDPTTGIGPRTCGIRGCSNPADRLDTIDGKLKAVCEGCCSEPDRDGGEDAADEPTTPRDMIRGAYARLFDR